MAQKLYRAGELGEYTIGAQDTAWYKASLYSEEEAVSAYQRVVDLLRKVLPATRKQVSSTVQTCGFPIPTTAQEWGRQVMVLKNLRRVLDVFQPEIFERDIDSMIEATKPKAQRKAEGSSMGFWERRAISKEVNVDAARRRAGGEPCMRRCSWWPSRPNSGTCSFLTADGRCCPPNSTTSSTRRTS